MKELEIMKKIIIFLFLFAYTNLLIVVNIIVVYCIHHIGAMASFCQQNVFKDSLEASSFKQFLDVYYFSKSLQKFQPIFFLLIPRKKRERKSNKFHFDRL